MTGRDRPELSKATEEAEESRRRAEQDAKRAHESARKALGLAEMLRRLREENGFEQMFLDAFGGRGG
ncbi:DUF7620 family protein [Microbispora sp. ATCC PTA-5024]|uniref:DUF7620 family protein n=1 Tax=Microbispora sp. ATCC PTA-5024 TaxID=316330 RepID=UPI0003DCBF90|nr:hypothetical protein [Microbispora sp. ATCC PTA-5024]ETK36111.1 hypothetical protein MPTA5024_10830 [Microbispora sp. ATCC PTA-5024]